LADAEFIVQLRTGIPGKTRFLHPISGNVSDQEAWISKYFSRPDDYYFVIYRLSDGRLEGVVGIYDVDLQVRSAEWGRWVLREGSLAAVETWLLVGKIAFGLIGLEELRCDTNAANKAVVSLHDGLGVRKVGLIQGRFFFNNSYHDAIRHACSRSEWSSFETLLVALASPIARRFISSR
jgi:RimJ/RimL family protein N-acetyltransferase